jgi:hypothetical protein
VLIDDEDALGEEPLSAGESFVFVGGLDAAHGDVIREAQPLRPIST